MHIAVVWQRERERERTVRLLPSSSSPLAKHFEKERTTMREQKLLCIKQQQQHQRVRQTGNSPAVESVLSYREEPVFSSCFFSLSPSSSSLKERRRSYDLVCSHASQFCSSVPEARSSSSVSAATVLCLCLCSCVPVCFRRSIFFVFKFSFFFNFF